MTAPAREWSLKRRLAIRLTVLAVAAILGPLAFTLLHARGQIHKLGEMALQQQAEAVAASVTARPDGGREVSTALTTAYRQAGDANLFVVENVRGQVLASSSATAERVLAGHDRPEEERFLISPVGGGSWLGYVHRAGDLKVIVAQDQNQDDVLADSIAYDFAEASLLLTLPLLLTVLGVVYLTLTVMFRRVDRAATAAAGLTPGQQAAPLPVEGLPREVVSLVNAVNLALVRLSQAYDTEKRFTADAAHELRTPLAILTARVETLSSSKDRAALQGDVARINRVVEQLLQAARLDARPVETAAFVDLGAVLLEAVADIAPLAVRQGREITLDVLSDQPIRVRGESGALSTVVSNLVDNALRHTPSGPIEIVARADGVFEVQDRGPGVSDVEKRLLFERFQRGQRPAGSGSGLGLAIVRQIVEQLGGTVDVSDRPGGGSVFAVRLPLVSSPSPQT